jgi:ribosomal protein L4
LHKNAELMYPELKNNIHCLLGQSANDFLEIFTNLYKKNIETAVLKKNLRNLYLSNWNQKKYDIFLNEVLNDFYSKHNVKNYYSFEIK